MSALGTHRAIVACQPGRQEPAELAVVTEDGRIFAAGEKVAREVEAVAINTYREFLLATGRLGLRIPLPRFSGFSSCHRPGD